MLPRHIPALSVAIAFRNAERTLASAVRSVLWQSFTDWELFLLDDGSTDGSVALAASFRDADPRITLLQDGENRGLPARLNQAVHQADGRFFARMDADDICYPERFARQIAFLEQNASVDLVGCGAMVFADDGTPLGAFPFRGDHAAICARPFSGFYLPHPSWTGRTEWFRRHPYDPDCLKAQDQDLLLRTHMTSRFAALPDILLGYRQESMTFAKAWRGRFFFSRSVWNFATEHHRRPAALAAILSQLLKLAYDFLTLRCGLRHFLPSHRFRPAPAEQVQHWCSLWQALHS